MVIAGSHVKRFLFSTLCIFSICALLASSGAHAIHRTKHAEPVSTVVSSFSNQRSTHDSLRQLGSHPQHYVQPLTVKHLSTANVNRDPSPRMKRVKTSSSKFNNETRAPSYRFNAARKRRNAVSKRVKQALYGAPSSQRQSSGGKPSQSQSSGGKTAYHSTPRAVQPVTVAQGHGKDDFSVSLGSNSADSGAMGSEDESITDETEMVESVEEEPENASQEKAALDALENKSQNPETEDETESEALKDHEALTHILAVLQKTVDRVAKLALKNQAAIKEYHRSTPESEADEEVQDEMGAETETPRLEDDRNEEEEFEDEDDDEESSEELVLESSVGDIGSMAAQGTPTLGHVNNIESVEPAEDVNDVGAEESDEVSEEDLMGSENSLSGATIQEAVDKLVEQLTTVSKKFKKLASTLAQAEHKHEKAEKAAASKSKPNEEEKASASKRNSLEILDSVNKPPEPASPEPKPKPKSSGTSSKPKPSHSEGSEGSYDDLDVDRDHVRMT